MPKNFVRSNVRSQRRKNYAQLDALTRTDVLHIMRHRFGKSELPDTEEGKRFFKAFLLKGMPPTQLVALASWSQRPDFFRLVHDADRDRRKPDADRLGNLIEFTFDELKALKRNGISIRHVSVFDAQPWQVAKFWNVERQEADRVRKKQERKEVSNMPAMSKRAALVYKAMNGSRWTNVSDIMTAVAPTLRGQRNRPLAPPVLRVTVHRALDELLASGVAEEKPKSDNVASRSGLPVARTRLRPR